MRKPQSLSADILPQPRWPVAVSRFVSFIDIMGFRSLLTDRFSPEQLYAFMTKMHDEAREAERIARKLHTNGEGVTLTGIIVPPGPVLVRIAQFSDSILVVTRDDGDVCSLAVQLAATKLFFFFLEHGVPVRGAIARGHVTADFKRSIFFGQSIVDAYLLEERQAWYGIAEHESCQDERLEGVPQIEPGFRSITWPYAVPVKDPPGTRMELAALNWPSLFESSSQMEERLAIWAPSTPDTKLRTYFTNTLQFGFDMWAHFEGRRRVPDGKPSPKSLHEE